MSDPRRGEVWVARLSPVVGHEQGGTRPVLVMSVDAHNSGPAGLVIVLPITSRHKYAIPMHLTVTPPEGGLTQPSVILCNAVRSVSLDRIESRWGRVSDATLEAAADRLSALLGL